MISGENRFPLLGIIGQAPFATGRGGALARRQARPCAPVSS
jgi:hypothetical protein